jgi:hypothetical protein
MFEAYSAMVELQARYGVDVGVPTFIVIGSQSSGKTTFLENLAGIPLGFTAAGRATRCPVIYKMEYDDISTEASAMFEGRPIPADSLPGEVERHMQSIIAAGGPGFSSTPISVHVKGPSCPNMVLVDTPGLVPNDDNKADRDYIEQAIATMARDLRYNIIVVAEYRTGFDVLSEIRLVDDLLTREHAKNPSMPPPRHNWKKDAMFVVNKIDLLTQQIAEQADLIKSLDGYKDKSDSKYFLTALRPNYPPDNPIRGGTKPSSAMLKEHLPRIREYEQGFLKHTRDSMGIGDDTWKGKGYDDFIGANSIISYVTSWWRRSLLGNTIDCVQKLQQEVQKATAAADELEEGVKIYGDAIFERSLVKHLQNYVTDFCNLLGGYCSTNNLVNVHMRYAREQIALAARRAENRRSRPESKTEAITDAEGVINFNRFVLEDRDVPAHELEKIWYDQPEKRVLDIDNEEEFPDVGSQLKEDVSMSKELWKQWPLYKQFLDTVKDEEAEPDDPIKMEVLLRGFSDMPRYNTEIIGRRVGFFSFRRILRVFLYLLYR